MKPLMDVFFPRPANVIVPGYTNFIVTGGEWAAAMREAWREPRLYARTFLNILTLLHRLITSMVKAFVCGIVLYVVTIMVLDPQFVSETISSMGRDPAAVTRLVAQFLFVGPVACFIALMWAYLRPGINLRFWRRAFEEHAAERMASLHGVHSRTLDSRTLKSAHE